MTGHSYRRYVVSPSVANEIPLGPSDNSVELVFFPPAGNISSSTEEMPHFMETEITLSCLQEPVMGSCLKANEYSLHYFLCYCLTYK